MDLCCDASQPPTCTPDNSQPDDIPRNILAFRTITTLLSQIQREQPFQIPKSDTVQLNREELRELRITNAFSTIAVIDNETVAIVINRESETLEVVASIQSPNGNLDIEPSDSLSEAFDQKFQSLGITNSPRSNALWSTTLPSGEPVITDGKVLAGLDLVDDEAIKLYVEARW